MMGTRVIVMHRNVREDFPGTEHRGETIDMIALLLMRSLLLGEKTPLHQSMNDAYTRTLSVMLDRRCNNLK